jgi:hypothetical protein
MILQYYDVPWMWVTQCWCCKAWYNGHRQTMAFSCLHCGAWVQP